LTKQTNKQMQNINKTNKTHTLSVQNEQCEDHQYIYILM